MEGMMPEGEALELFESCSNAGRWGSDDELGTLNFITDSKRIEAARVVRHGRAVSIARTLPLEPTPSQPIAVRHRMHYVAHTEPFGCADSFDIYPHGYGITHLDAVGHIYFDGRIYNGRRAADVIGSEGMHWGSIMASSGGLVTRAVLLDVARARGVDWLPAGDRVTYADLDAAEDLSGTRVASGDAVLVRIGLPAREASEGANPALQAGLGADCLPWLHEREVAIYGGDCAERTPSEYPRIMLPLHQIGMAAMGLCILDNTDLEELATAARDLGQSEMLLSIGPLPLPGGTCSPVNPICLL
jgi:kynurenine formamidase